MDLHRAASQPDWEHIDRNKRSLIQNVAAASWGLLTPGNVLTIVGFMLVVTGCLELVVSHYWTGFLMIGGGRLCDLADGWVAQLTATKGPMGEFLDATVDKFCGIFALLTLWLTELAPRWALIVIFVPQLLISVLSIVALLRDKPYHPVRAGKLSMAFGWVGLTGYVLVAAIGNNQAWLHIIAAGASISAGLLGVIALLTYVRRPSL